MKHDIITVMKHELIAMRRSSRIWIGAGLYTVMGLISGLIYVLVVRGIEKNAIKLFTRQGGDPSALPQAMNAAADQAYRSLIQFFAEDQAMVDALIQVPAILLFAFWGTLTFLPFFLVLFSYDQMASDIQYRSVSYPLLRTSRPSLFLGKLAAHMVLFLGLAILLNTSLFVFGWAILERFDITAALAFQLKSYLILLPFGLCYLSLIALWSSLTQTPFISLLLGFASLFFLWIINILRHLEGLSSHWGLLSYLSYLSPSHWEPGLWSHQTTSLLTTCAIYIAFALVFSGLGLWRFLRRDL